MMSTPSGAWDDGRAALAPDPVAAEVQRDPVQPGRELRLSLEPAERPERAQKRLLRHVARVFLAADDAVRQGIDRPLPAQHELVEAVEIAPHRAGDQLFVCRRHPDGRSVTLRSPAFRSFRRRRGAAVGSHFTFSFWLAAPQASLRWPHSGACHFGSAAAGAWLRMPSSGSMPLHTPFSTLARRRPGGQPSDLLPELHRKVLEETGGSRSVLLQPRGPPADYTATSGHGFDDLGGIWLAGAEASAVDASSAPHMAWRAQPGDLPGAPGRLERDRRADRAAAGAAPSAFLASLTAMPGADAIARGARARPSSRSRSSSRASDTRPRFTGASRSCSSAFSRGVSATLQRRRGARDARGRDQRPLRREAHVGLAARSPRRRAGARRLVRAGPCRGERRRRPTTRRRPRRAASASIGRRSPTEAQDGVLDRAAARVAARARHARRRRRGRGRRAADDDRSSSTLVVRARPAALGRHRERPAARRHPAAAPAARGHVQLARRSRRRHRQRACASSR